MAKNIEMQYYNGTSYEVCYPTVNLAENVTGVLPSANGGTGHKNTITSAGAYALMRKAGDGDYMWYTNTANGAFYATGANTNGKFGTLPIAQGGTGATSASGALSALGAASASSLTSLTTRVSSLESLSSPFYLELVASGIGTSFYFTNMQLCVGLLFYMDGGTDYSSNQGTGEIYLSYGNGGTAFSAHGLSNQPSINIYWKTLNEGGINSDGDILYFIGFEGSSTSEGGSTVGQSLTISRKTNKSYYQYKISKRNIITIPNFYIYKIMLAL